MLRILLITTIVSLALSLWAQRQPVEDVVYLKNGSILRGQIREQYPDSILKLAMNDGSLWVFQTNEILKLTRETPTHNTSQIRGFQKGFYHTGQIGIFLPNGKVENNLAETYLNEDEILGFYTQHGYAWRPFLHTGAGIGIESYQNGLILPLYLDLRGDLGKGRKNSALKPHYYLQAGYAFPLYDELTINLWRWGQRIAQTEGGIRYGAGLGLRIYTEGQVNWIVSLGYNYQETALTYDGWQAINERIEERFGYERLALMIGILIR